MFRWSASWGCWPITHEVPSGRDTHSACGSSARSPRPPARLDLMRARDRARGIPTIKTRMGNEAQVLALTELRVEGRRECPTITKKMQDWRGGCSTGWEPREEGREHLKTTTGRQGPGGAQERGKRAG